MQGLLDVRVLSFSLGLLLEQSFTVYFLASASATEQTQPMIVSRADWKAAPPLKDLMRPQKPAEIVIHHTGVAQKPAIPLERKLKGLQEFSQRPGTVGMHTKPAWGDVPYHFYIDVHGRIGQGRDINFAGDTNTSYDTANRIQIVVEGNFEVDHPSSEQLSALRQLVLWLAAKYKIDPKLITAHNDHAETDCPGKFLKPYVALLRTAAKEN
jgi:hypothetical protein